MKKALLSLLFLGAMSTGCMQACPAPAPCEPCEAAAPAAEPEKNAADEAKKADDGQKEGTMVDVPETNDMQEVFGFLKAVKTYYIATVDGDQPRVRPFGTVEIFDGHLYFQTGKKKNVAHQIDANPKVEICAFDGVRWLRLAGTAVEDDRAEAQTHMLDAYPSLKSMYAVGDGNTVVYYLKDATAKFSTFGQPDREIKF